MNHVINDDKLREQVIQRLMRIEIVKSVLEKQEAVHGLMMDVMSVSDKERQDLVNEAHKRIMQRSSIV